MALLVLALDQLTKWIVYNTLGPGGDHGPVTIIPKVLDFRFVRNTGTAFGLFPGNSELLRILALGAVLVLVIMYIRTARDSRLVAVALGLQVGGALGNIVDRFEHGYVIDFIDFPRFPTFNVADIAITLGVIALMIALIFFGTVEEPSPGTPVEASRTETSPEDSA